jgi:hypothetical protein
MAQPVLIARTRGDKNRERCWESLLIVQSRLRHGVLDSSCAHQNIVAGPATAGTRVFLSRVSALTIRVSRCELQTEAAELAVALAQAYFLG